jgi:hypothetical protein
MKLSEGLRKGDLDGLILPLITVDEYESKIGDDQAVVVGFYVLEQDAAHDLSNFMERAPYMVMDTDVSPAPTKDGYYVCFVEINRTLDFPKALISLLNDITKLCNVEDWQFTTVKLPKDKIVPLTEKNLEKHVNCNPKESENNSEENVKRFFKHSSLNETHVNPGFIAFGDSKYKGKFKIVALTNQTPEGPVDLSETGSAQCRVLEQALAGPYSVHKLGAHLVVENWNLQKFLVLKPL